VLEWVHTSSVILTDALYFSYIGDPLYTGTATQRNAAYLMAEQAMIQYLKTPLLPTAITGTFIWPSLRGMDSYTIGESTIKLPFTWLQSIEAVSVLSGGGTGTCGLQATDGCYRIRDRIGYLDVFCIGNLVRQQCGSASLPYQVQVAFTAGLPTGIAADDLSLHMALAMKAEEVLNEIVDPGANPGGPGAPGVKNWSTLGYSETPLPESLEVTPLGNSARMNRAVQLVRHLKKKRAFKF
jgi:hypothetical protein